MIILNSSAFTLYFKVVSLYHDATVEQFIALLEQTISIYYGSASYEGECFSCSMVQREEMLSNWIKLTPKFDFRGLKSIYTWMLEKKIDGGFCKDTSNLVSEMATTEEDKQKFINYVEKMLKESKQA